MSLAVLGWAAPCLAQPEDHPTLFESDMSQGGPSGDEAVESSNWNMLMLQRDVAGGRLTFMMMNSLEPATFPEEGRRSCSRRGNRSRASLWWTASIRTTSS